MSESSEFWERIYEQRTRPSTGLIRGNDNAGRRVLMSEQRSTVDALSDPSVDLWLWQRKLSGLIADRASELARSSLSLCCQVDVAAAHQQLTVAVDASEIPERNLFLWAHELCGMVELLGRLGHERLLLRLQGGPAAAQAPRFHVDGGSVRLLCTYHGPGTEWLPEHAANRVELARQRDHPHRNRPIARNPRALQRTRPGWVAIIRGADNAKTPKRGLVHRSPPSREPRLLLRIDPR